MSTIFFIVFVFIVCREGGRYVFTSRYVTLLPHVTYIMVRHTGSRAVTAQVCALGASVSESKYLRASV